MRVCHIVPSLEERHGGPSRSVPALADAQARLEATVDLLYTHPAGDAGTKTDTVGAQRRGFERGFPASVYRSPALYRHLQATLYDCIHSHALWILTLGYAADTARRRDVPLVISPRGMLTPWAHRHHRGRKFIAEKLFHPGALSGASGWHATSREEADDIRRLGFTQPICVAPNGVPIPDAPALERARMAWLELVPAARTRPVALFYSRFHRKKRVRELLDLWLAANRGDWLLLLAGVPEEYSVDEIQGCVVARGAEDRVVVIDGRERPAPYAIASLFLLPSHSENFGLVIAEAMAAGVPALVTDGTPWSPATTRQAGWCVAWPDYARALENSLRLPRSELEAMGRGAREWMATEYSWERAGRLLLTFYQQLIRG